MSCSQPATEEAGSGIIPGGTTSLRTGMASGAAVRAGYARRNPPGVRISDLAWSVLPGGLKFFGLRSLCCLYQKSSTFARTMRQVRAEACPPASTGIRGTRPPAAARSVATPGDVPPGEGSTTSGYTVEHLDRYPDPGQGLSYRPAPANGPEKTPHSEGEEGTVRSRKFRSRSDEIRPDTKRAGGNDSQAGRHTPRSNGRSVPGSAGQGRLIRAVLTRRVAGQ